MVHQLASSARWSVMIVRSGEVGFVLPSGMRVGESSLRRQKELSMIWLNNKLAPAAAAIQRWWSTKMDGGR